MKVTEKYIIVLLALYVLLASCSTLEKASRHGFNSGYYKLATKNKNTQPVYADVTADKLDVYQAVNKQPDKQPFLSVPLLPSDSFMLSPMVFHKASLDIDLTSVFFIFLPSVYGSQQQLTTDFNIALYA
jgi:hypothetical protein